MQDQISKGNYITMLVEDYDGTRQANGNCSGAKTNCVILDTVVITNKLLGATMWTSAETSVFFLSNEAQPIINNVSQGIAGKLQSGNYSAQIFI